MDRTMNPRMMAKTRFLTATAALVLANGIAMADGSHGGGHDVAVGEAVATVNGRPISQLSLERVTQQLSAQGQQPNREQIIDELINLEILTQAAEQMELDKSDDVATALHLQYTQTMANAYLGVFSNDLKISEEQIRAEYDKQIALIKASEYKASHILLDSKEDAEKVIADLNGGGDFVQLAKTRSTGPSSATGGDLGWFQPENMVPEFSAAVATMEKGSVSVEPVQTEFGWHVIKLDDVREAAKPDYSPAVKSGIQNTLLREALAKEVEGLRADAKIEMK